jgi:Zn-dependent peptidase ImmA (M78 family)/transcriptional regulator with XRE-family HTH domain
MLRMARQRAPVEPAVLRWARETAGLAEDEAARRIGVSEERLVRAESGESPLTLNQARKAADVYRRPLAILFLPAPPEEASLEVQFRRFRDAPDLPWPPAMRALAREVPALQEEAVVLFEAIEEEPRWPQAVLPPGARADDVDRLAQQLRDVVGVPVEEQKAAARADPQGFRTFRVWREAIEDLGILVLQDGSLSLDDMRGFVSPHERVPALVINTNDDVRARLFTMLHEFAHLVWPAAGEEPRYEELAGATLMPASPFAADLRRATGSTLLERIDATARLYGTTPDATAVRAGWLRLVPWEEISEVRAAIRRRGGNGGGRASGGNFYRNVVARMGPGFVRRVLDGVSQNAISELSAARVLGVRVGRFESLRDEVGGMNVA